MRAFTLSCRVSTAIVLGAAAALALPSTVAAQSTLDRIKEENVIRVGVANERPYAYVTGDGELRGEAPAIAREVLERIDPEIRMEPVVTEFRSLIEGLQAGAFDMIAAGMFVTPERCAEVAFSEPTYKIGQAFAVRAGNPKGLTDYGSVANADDAKVGLMAGAVEYNYAYDAGIPGDRALLFPDPETGLEELKEGDIDAVGLTSLSIRSLTADDPDVESTPQFYPVVDGATVAGYGAFAFRQEDEDLRAAFNEKLSELVGSDEHWDAVAEYGFAPDMAPDKTTAELCEE